MNRDRFRRLVLRAVRSIPWDLQAQLDNVEIIVRREPSASHLELSGIGPGTELFGLYVGTPRTDRSEYNLTLPDQIFIFQGPLERHFARDDIREQVRRTVIHEIAHHFGIDDERLTTLGVH